MSRVERHKDEYAKADREAIENSRTVRNTAVNESAPARTGRAARNAAAESEALGGWDQTEEEKRRARKEARAMGDGRPEFHGGRAFGTLLGFIGTLILILAIAACLGLTVPRFAGIEQYVVISGSMEPAIPVGSMVYSGQTDPSTLEAGDIIVFGSTEGESAPITHRVVENRLAEGEVVTKGDANPENDLNPVPYSSILGKVQLHIPMLGFIAAPLGSLAGKIAMGCVIIAAYLLTVVGGNLRKK